MAGSSISGDGEGLNASINVTPLVDVMLVLLVIFMITAPMMQQGVDVELPKTSSSAMRSKEDPLVVSIKSDGTIYIGDGNPVDLSSIGARVKAILDTQAQGASSGDENAGLRKVFVKADQGLQYGQVMALMGALHESGIAEVGLVTEPGSPAKPVEAKAGSAQVKR